MTALLITETKTRTEIIRKRVRRYLSTANPGLSIRTTGSHHRKGLLVLIQFQHTPITIGVP